VIKAIGTTIGHYLNK